MNPVVYLISGMRWAFYGKSDVDVTVSACMIAGFLVAGLVVIRWIFHTGRGLKS